VGRCPVIGFRHTAEVHVVTFDALVAERAPERPTTSLVAEDLLVTARSAGLDDASLARGVVAALRELEARGAGVIVCTCSTIAGLAEALSGAQVPVLRVDRPMAELAVAAGPRVAVLAALESTIAPTVALLREVAAAVGADVTVDARVVDGAWACFEAGDLDSYSAVIADTCIDVASTGDVIVLAQASMAGAVARLAEDFPIPVLSSPGPAVDAALRC
jgi:Asp/Glu/hydantoin racemase